jgi:GDPmannose 4,6-dehydratase
LAFAEAGLDYRDFVRKDEAVFRPAEVDLLIGDASKAHSSLPWTPTIDFRTLVKEMIHADLELLSSRGSKQAGNEHANSANTV